MAALGSLHCYFEKPMQEKASLLDALRQIKTFTPVELATFTEIFGELHFKENPSSNMNTIPRDGNNNNSIIDDDRLSKNFLKDNVSIGKMLQTPSPSPSKATANDESFSEIFGELYFKEKPRLDEKKIEEEKKPTQSNSSHGAKCTELFPVVSEKLQLCTEGLGFESSGEMEEPMPDSAIDKKQPSSSVGRGRRVKESYGVAGIRKTRPLEFPPPIPSIGINGQPFFSFKSYRHDGRFVLKEVRTPNQEFLHASRADGRLKLHLVLPDSEPETEEDNKASTSSISSGELESQDCANNDHPIEAEDKDSIESLIEADDQDSIESVSVIA